MLLRMGNEAAVHLILIREMKDRFCLWWEKGAVDDDLIRNVVEICGLELAVLVRCHSTN